MTEIITQEWQLDLIDQPNKLFIGTCMPNVLMSMISEYLLPVSTLSPLKILVNQWGLDKIDSDEDFKYFTINGGMTIYSATYWSIPFISQNNYSSSLDQLIRVKGNKTELWEVIVKLLNGKYAIFTSREEYTGFGNTCFPDIITFPTLQELYQNLGQDSKDRFQESQRLFSKYIFV